jgi:sulfide:quinone oxidoreductase
MACSSWPRRCCCRRRKHGLLIPGPHVQAMKLAVEKYFLWKARHGYINLP